MTDAWQTYQTQLAALLWQQSIPVSAWRPGRLVVFSPLGTPPARNGHHQSVTHVVRLPGIRPSECCQLLVRTR